MFQTRYRVEDLEVVKPLYNQWERKLATYANRAMIALCIVQFLHQIANMMLIYTKRQRSISLYCCVAFSSILVVLLVVALFTYVAFNAANLTWINKKHYFAFKTHAPKLIALITLTGFSLAFEVARELQWGIFRIC